MTPRSFASGAFFVMCALLILGGQRAQAACQVTARRTVPIEMVGGLMVVTVTVNGQAAPFLLDTGAERSVVGNQSALALNIARDEWVSTDVMGFGGRERERLGRPGSLSLGGLPLRRNTMAADNSVVVGTIPAEIGGHPIAGLLGQDFLSVFDLDIDPARRQLTLYDVAGCVGAFLPWKEPYSAMQAIRLARNILALPVRVDGQQLNAEIDSGAQQSVLLASGLQHMGLVAGGHELARGFGGGGAPARRQSFASVEIGGETFAGMTLVLAPVHMLRSIDMLLGADWLNHRHVWLSWSTNQVLVGKVTASSLKP